MGRLMKPPVTVRVQGPGHTDDNRAFAARVDTGYGGRGVVPRFWLYDWRRDGFKLTRAATEGSA